MRRRRNLRLREQGSHPYGSRRLSKRDDVSSLLYGSDSDDPGDSTTTSRPQPQPHSQNASYRVITEVVDSDRRKRSGRVSFAQDEGVSAAPFFIPTSTIDLDDDAYLDLLNVQAYISDDEDDEYAKEGNVFVPFGLSGKDVDIDDTPVSPSLGHAWW